MGDLLFKLMMINNADNGVSANGWDLDTFFNNLFKSLGSWGSAIVMIIGIILIIVGIVQVAKGLMSGGRGQTNWVLAIGMILLGGVLAMSTSWALLRNLGAGAKSTVDKMGNSSQTTMILPILRSILPF